MPSGAWDSIAIGVHSGGGALKQKSDVNREGLCAMPKRGLRTWIDDFLLIWVSFIWAAAAVVFLGAADTGSRSESCRAVQHLIEKQPSPEQDGLRKNLRTLGCEIEMN